MSNPIPLARPNITQAERDAVLGVLNTPLLSLGPKVVEFEEAFADYCGTRHAISCSSGTAALHLVIRAFEIGPGDEVITTPFSFVASANCALFEGAKPVFVDIDPANWCIDPTTIRSAVSDHTKAILPVDVFGQTADIGAIRPIAQEHELVVIEDSCEALGSCDGGKFAGSLGDAGVFGFYPNKQITTGEGGMIVTDNETVANLCRSMRNQGRDVGSGWLAHQRLGYNYRLSDINAALGLAQLLRINEIVEVRRTVYEWYRQRLAGEDRLLLQQVRPGCDVSWFVFVVRLTDAYSRTQRDGILRNLAEVGIGCSNYFVPIHVQPFYTDLGYKPGDFPICESVADRTIALPFHHELTEADVDRVCTELQKNL